MIKSVSALVLTCRDVNRTADFYLSLGFLPVEAPEGSRTVRMNWFRLFLEPGEPTAEGAARYIIATDDPEEVMRVLAEAGLQAGPVTGKLGKRTFDAADPDGHPIRFQESGVVASSSR